MNKWLIREACLALGHEEPISIEPDGTVWLGADDDRSYPDMKPIMKKVVELESAQVAVRESARAKLVALGLTDEEIKALIG